MKKEKESVQTKAKSKTGKPGRPRAEIKVPNRKFTFADLQKENPNLKPLTLRNFLKRDMKVIDKETGEVIRNRENSLIVLVRGEKRAPSGEKGLGRKTLVYARRSLIKNADNLKKSKGSKVSVDMAENAPADNTQVAEAASA